jgi:hypothetical protein
VLGHDLEGELAMEPGELGGEVAPEAAELGRPDPVAWTGDGGHPERAGEALDGLEVDRLLGGVLLRAAVGNHCALETQGTDEDDGGQDRDGEEPNGSGGE